MPPNLVRFKMVTTLENSEDLSGFLKLVSSLPRGLEEFSFVFEAWEAFRSDFFLKIVSHLPRSIQKLSLIQYGGYYISDGDLQSFAKEIKTNLTDMKEFYLHTRSNAEEIGGYQVRTIESLDDLYSYV